MQSFYRKQTFCKMSMRAHAFSVVREINLAFDCAPSDDVRGVFLYITKVFDKVWHQVLIYKLESCRGKLLDLLTNFLHELVQRAVLNGQVPTESVFYLLPALILINMHKKCIF